MELEGPIGLPAEVCPPLPLHPHQQEHRRQLERLAQQRWSIRGLGG